MSQSSNLRERLRNGNSRAFLQWISGACLSWSSSGHCSLPYSRARLRPSCTQQSTTNHPIAASRRCDSVENLCHVVVVKDVWWWQPRNIETPPMLRWLVLWIEPWRYLWWVPVPFPLLACWYWSGSTYFPSVSASMSVEPRHNLSRCRPGFTWEKISLDFDLWLVPCVLISLSGRLLYQHGTLLQVVATRYTWPRSICWLSVRCYSRCLPSSSKSFLCARGSATHRRDRAFINLCFLPPLCPWKRFSDPLSNIFFSAGGATLDAWYHQSLPSFARTLPVGFHTKSLLSFWILLLIQHQFAGINCEETFLDLLLQRHTRRFIPFWSYPLPCPMHPRRATWDIASSLLQRWAIIFAMWVQWPIV